MGANERIRVAVIGLGWCCELGMNHLFGISERSKENNTQVVAGCDPFSRHRQSAAQRIGLSESDFYADYRKVLERPDVDAVVIATPEHLHGRIALDALEAGKHVYCERPFTRYLGEAFQVWDKVKSTGKTFQLGVQMCSAGAWQRCAELIQTGKIGTLVWTQGYYCRNSHGGEWNYMIEPEVTLSNLDWQQWLGPDLQGIPFSAEDFARPNKYYRYSSGLLGTLASSRLYPLILASGAPEFPRRVTSISTHNVHSDRTVAGTPERDVPEHAQFIAEFPSGHLITVTASSVNAKSPGFAIYGHKATLNVGASGEWVELAPEKDFSQEVQPEKWSKLQPEDVRLHEKNWFDCIRSGKQPNANIELAIRGQTVLSLAEISDRLKLCCLFDERSRRIMDGSGRTIEPLSYRSGA